MPQFNIDVSQIAWFFSFLASVFCVAAISGFQVWERIEEVEHGTYNTDGDLLISSVNPYPNVNLDSTNPAFDILRRSYASIASEGPGGRMGRHHTVQSTNQTSNFTVTVNDGVNVESATMQLRWIPFSTHELHAIAITSLLATLSSIMGTLNAVFNIRSRAFMCMQQIWLFFAFLFQLVAMILVHKNEDSMASICPYKSYRVMGWLGAVCGLLALVFYCTLDPICCCLRRPPPPTPIYEECDTEPTHNEASCHWR